MKDEEKRPSPETPSDTRSDRKGDAEAIPPGAGLRSAGIALVPVLVFTLTIVTGFILWAGRPLPLPDDLEAFLRGRYTETVDERFETEHPLRQVALTTITAMRLAIFREGSGPLVIDRNYRLYTLEEFEHHPSDADALERRLAWIGEVSQRLRADDVPLIVVLVPSKARVKNAAPERLVDHPRWTEALDALQKRSVVTVDALSVLAGQEGSFLRTDTHWTPEGATAVAQAVASHFQKFFPDRTLPETRFEYGEQLEFEHEGDLLQFVPLGLWGRFFPLEPDQVRRPVVEVGRSVAGGLFDTPEIPVALVGTSFSAGDNWDFPGALQHSLQADILDAAEEGLGPYVPMEQYLTSRTYREIPPSLVIWEIPERYLTLPDTVVPETSGVLNVGCRSDTPH